MFSLVEKIDPVTLMSPYGSEVTSGNKDERQNTMKRYCSIALTAHEIPRVLGTVSQERWTKFKYEKQVFGHLSNQIRIPYKSQYHRRTNGNN